MTDMGQTLDLNPTFITSKGLTRSKLRGHKVFGLHKVQFPAQASLQLKNAARALHRRVLKLQEPVKRIIQTRDGEEVVEINDDAALCAVTRALREVIDQRRIILRIPEPGRDSPIESKTIDMQPADIVDAMPGESAAQPGPASEPSQAEPSQGS